MPIINNITALANMNILPFSIETCITFSRYIIASIHATAKIIQIITKTSHFSNPNKYNPT